MRAICSIRWCCGRSARKRITTSNWNSGRGGWRCSRATGSSAAMPWSWCSRASDAAGKGGAIRRVAGALDARQYRIVPIAAPTAGGDCAQPYLWRFWRQVPRYRPRHRVRPLLVRPRAGRARRGPLRRGGLDARLCRDQRLRGPTGAARRGAGQVLDGHQPGGAVAALRGAREDALQALQDHRARTGATAASGATTSMRSAI